MAIEDYAIIGDCRSAALVSRANAIDWLAWPRFESDAIFAALLDEERGGSWSITPRGLACSKRHYVGESAVLETVFEDGAGSELALVDLMPIAGPEDRDVLHAEHELLRLLVCRRGTVTVDVRFAPRPAFGKERANIRLRGKLGARIEARNGLFTLLTDAPEPAARVEDGEALVWTFTLHAGDVVRFSLSWATDAPAVLSPLRVATEIAVGRTLRHWNAWSSRTKHAGANREAVIRSLITLRLLAYAPSGAIVAAPTTSLPEIIGGGENWDYRYCWLRDAALTVNGLIELGHPEEARGFSDWLLHATRLTQPRLEVLYDVFGRRPRREDRLSRSRGYEGSSPVRIGNAAASQTQLDAYGEVVDALWRMSKAGVDLDRDARSALVGFGRYVCEHWAEPDSGIWESRGPRRRYVHSAALSWTALDRLLDLEARGILRTKHRDRFGETRARIARELETRAFNPALGSYTSVLGGEDIDASVMLLPWYGYEKSGSPRMRSTFARVMKELSPGPGLLRRNHQLRGEGAFGLCSFWIAEHLASGGGTLEQARAAFDATTSYANDVGLFAEEIDPKTGAALGNFPQTFTHVGLLNAALAIERRGAAA